MTAVMPKVHSHKVKLVGVDGQEQAVVFDIETEGVHLLNQKAQVGLDCIGYAPPCCGLMFPTVQLARD